MATTPINVRWDSISGPRTVGLLAKGQPGFIINWGDGTTETVTLNGDEDPNNPASDDVARASHAYAQDGTYTVLVAENPNAGVPNTTLKAFISIAPTTDQVINTASNFKDIVLSGSGNDLITTGGGDDWAVGGDGNDTINGSTGVDVLIGDGGADSLNGGTGGDLLAGGSGNDTLLGGADGDSLFGDEGDDLIRGQADNDFVEGGDGADKIYGDAGVDNLNGGGDNDTIYGGADGDTINGDGGLDTLTGDAGADTIAGGDGNDRLNGGLDNDNLFGGLGADVLNGNDGDDLLAGDVGNDILTGGLGADTFIYLTSADSAPSAGNLDRDRIQDFNQAEGDQIDLSAIIAATGGSATFLGETTDETAFTGGGSAELLFYNPNGSVNFTIVALDQDGNGTTDLQLLLRGDFNLTTNDFIL